MNKTTTNIILMLITILAGTYFYINCCSECGMSSNQDPPEEQITVTPPVVPKSTSYPFVLESEDFSFNSEDNYNFNLSSNSYLQPLSDHLSTGISGLADYLNSHKDKTLIITGFHLSSEENLSAYPSLGLARANSIKNNLATKGIATNQIITVGKEMPNMIPKEDVLLGAASFNLAQKNENSANETMTLFAKINDKPLVFHFNTAEASIHLSNEQRQKVAEISRYLDITEESIVNIVGHTDNTGTPATNKKLGLDRANFAKEYLIANGINEDRIIVSSKGETEPIAPNNTEEGKNKNRRTVITLK